MHDEHGQAPSRAINLARITDRATDELIGLCKGMLSDKTLAQSEVEYLMGWLRANQEAKNQWPGSVLHARIVQYLEEGCLDEDEKADLFNLTAGISGYTKTLLGVNLSGCLPFDDPLPEFCFDGTLFCLTGRFAYGTRHDCEETIRSLGGLLCDAPRKQECILVVGFFGSRDWIHSTHGRKIESGIAMRDQGIPVSIISKDYWAQSMLSGLGL